MVRVTRLRWYRLGNEDLMPDRVSACEAEASGFLAYTMEVEQEAIESAVPRRFLLQPGVLAGVGGPPCS